MQKDWQLRLGDANSTEEVLWVARDFLAQWTPEQIAELPEHCRPGRLADADDIASYALSLVKHQCDGESWQVAAPIQEMASFFIAAATRVSQIMSFAAHRSAISRAHV